MTGPINNNQDKSIEEAVQQFVDAQLQGREPDIDEKGGGRLAPLAPI